MGYEHYLQLVGWDFTNTDEFGDIINWENLLLKFLEWQAEAHDVGDFITLTPLLTGGSFDATYGVASVASETRTVSQPTNIKYDSKPGTRFPFIPKAARDRTIVGALDRFPASELNPTKRKERTVPIIAAKVACQNEIPKPRKNEP